MEVCNLQSAILTQREIPRCENVLAYELPTINVSRAGTKPVSNEKARSGTEMRNYSQQPRLMPAPSPEKSGRSVPRT